MNDHAHLNGPVIIGGIGGSGTRVVAEIINRLGFYIGNDLNESNDNLLYTLLFKQPKWFRRYHRDRQRMAVGIGLFEKLMLGEGKPNVSELFFLVRSVATMVLYGNNAAGDENGYWPLERLGRALRARQHITADHLGWGWKEPNSHLLLEYLAEHFHGLRYIHVVRHGLDMAFSANQQQLYNWGPLYGVEGPVSRLEEPSASLKYWIRANESVVDFCKKIGADRVLLIDFDDLCLSPGVGVLRLIAFLGIEVDEQRLDELVRLPQAPGSMGRYKHQDLRQFDEEDLGALAKFGYSIEPLDS